MKKTIKGYYKESHKLDTKTHRKFLWWEWDEQDYRYEWVPVEILAKETKYNIEGGDCTTYLVRKGKKVIEVDGYKVMEKL